MVKPIDGIRKKTWRDGEPTPTAASSVMHMALLIAARFKGAPDVAVLEREYRMCRATAYRWRRAFIEAEAQRAARYPNAQRCKCCDSILRFDPKPEGTP